MKDQQSTWVNLDERPAFKLTNARMSPRDRIRQGPEKNNLRFLAACFLATTFASIIVSSPFKFPLKFKLELWEEHIGMASFLWSYWAASPEPKFPSPPTNPLTFSAQDLAEPIANHTSHSSSAPDEEPESIHSSTNRNVLEFWSPLQILLLAISLPFLPISFVG